jgi:hypothetical protein
MSSNNPIIPSLESYLVSHGLNDTFDFIEITNSKTHSLLIKPKDVAENQWLKVFVINADKHADDLFSVTLYGAPTDVVVVVAFRSVTDQTQVEFANLFQENDFPLNQPVYLHMPPFDMTKITQRLEEFYANTPLFSTT